MNGRILISKLLSVHMPALNTQDMAKGQSIDICETNSKRRLIVLHVWMAVWENSLKNQVFSKHITVNYPEDSFPAKKSVLLLTVCKQKVI